MRIVDVCAFYAPEGGGVKTYVDRKMAAGAAAGHEIVVIAPGPERRTIECGAAARMEVIPAPPMPLDKRYHYFDDEPALHDLLDTLAPDFVEASSPWSSAAMVARWPGAAPRALIMHADPLAAYAYRWFGRFASHATIDRGFGWYWRHLQRLDRRFDVVVSAGAQLTRRLTKGGLRRVWTNPLGVERGLFSPARRDAELRARLLAQCNLPEDAALLIGVGRFSAEKRWPMVVEAATAAGYRRPVGLVLVGDGRQAEAVQRAAGRNPHIAILPPIANRETLAAMLASADALVHGCEAETFCLIAAEARASGLPLIVPDRGGARDQIERGRGLAYRAADTGDLMRAIVAMTGGALARHRARAHADAAATRAIDDHFASLFGLYEALCGAERAAA